MFGFMAHPAANTPGVPDFFLRTLGMTLLAKTIGKVKGVKIFSGKKAEGHNAIP